MKTLLALSAFFVALPAFAGTATVWKNEPLGFQITASPQDENITFCDAKDSCLEFAPVKYDGKQLDYKLCDGANPPNCRSFKEAGPGDKDVERYREVHGKCQLEMKLVSLDYGGFMLDMMFQVVKVTRGSDNCKLDSGASGKRPLFGIYQ